jgi:hypothetical protein
VSTFTDPFLETLETRRLFAGVGLAGRVLVIRGTNQNDNLVVANVSSSAPDRLQVRVNQHRGSDRLFGGSSTDNFDGTTGKDADVEAGKSPIP